MSEYKVSIVMPVYNTKAEYLEKSVNSVLNQSYKNFELLIIDDGSLLECAQHCDALSKQDPRISVVHQKNSGVSTARNNGTTMANGDYIMYVDSDDVLASFALEEAVYAARETGAQFIFAGLQYIYDFSEFVEGAPKDRADFRLYDKSELNEVRKAFLTQQNKEYKQINGIGGANRGPCARLIRADVAKAVAFDSRLVLGEDVEWNLRILNACDRVCFIPNVWYGYLMYSTSSMKKYYGNRAELLERYLKTLYENNKSYCDSHPEDYAVNMVVCFYTMVLFEYLPKDVPLSKKEKSNQIKQILKREPWCRLMDKQVSRCVPMRHRVFLIACKYGVGLGTLIFWRNLKHWVRFIK